jgi:hypothetical protein
LIEVLVLLQEDLTMNILEKCKQSQPAIKGIIESTTDDEGMLFEALYLHDELQQVISKYEQLEAAQKPGGQQQPDNSDPIKYEQLEATQKSGELPETSDASKCEELEAAEKLGENLPEKSYAPEPKSPPVSENNLVDSPRGDDADSSHEKKKGE